MEDSRVPEDDIHLALAKDVFPHINATEERVNATVDASVEEFLELHKDDSDISELRVQMLNNVKKCTSCGKPCAYTTAACNNCGNSAVQIRDSTSQHVCSSQVTISHPRKFRTPTTFSPASFMASRVDPSPSLFLSGRSLKTYWSSTISYPCLHAM